MKKELRCAFSENIIGKEGKFNVFLSIYDRENNSLNSLLRSICA